MPKFSVKKPYTVLVGVVLILVLGVVSLMGMQTDLLPAINLPYIVVVTTYPGASPERVESDITAPLESALGTVNGVENVTSTSSENYSMVMLEFAEDTDMDSAMVKTSTQINQLADTLPDLAGTPMLMEMSADMMATQYIAVDYEGMDIYDLSAYAQQKVIPSLERVNGVASVSATGLVEHTVQVTLDQAKIDQINDRLLVKVSDRLAEAKAELEKAEKELNNGAAQISESKEQLAAGQAELDTQQKSIANQLNEVIAGINDQIPGIESEIGALEGQIAGMQSQLGQVEAKLNGFANGNVDAFTVMRNTLAAYDPEYAAHAGEMPTSLADALANDGAKLAAMNASIERCIAAITSAGAQQAGIAEKIAESEAELQQLNDRYTELENQIVEAQRAEDAAALADLQAQQNILVAQRLAVTETLANLKATQNIANDPVPDTLSAEALRDFANALAEAKKIQDALNKATAALTGLKNQLGELNSYRGELQQALIGLEANPLDETLGDTASALLFSGMNAQLALGQSQIASGEAQIESGRTQLEAAKKEYESAREEALQSANLDALLNMQTLAQLMGAQNFSMPAGYIQDGDEQYLLKVGDTFESVDELAGALLCSVDGIGDVRLSDVADIQITDNAGEGYSKVDGNQAVLLAVYKSSTASTSEVSDACNAALANMMTAEPDLHLITIMDQGDYIRLIIDNVMSNLIWGAILAVIVLALFLQDIRPTLVVAISIPLSVLFAIVLMYFTGISLNMISLSGLALGIGMLVDNSIVVIENIYRLRNRGVPPARAAVQGARQVSSAIIASTLTTICVFLPLVFSTGLTRELLTDMALTIAYSLFASLAIALTVVPCAGSTLLKKTTDKKHPLFDKVTELYETALRFCLRVKALPLTLAIGLLAFSVWQLTQVGIVLIPEMSSNELSVSITTPQDTADTDAYATVDEAMQRMMAVDEVETVGIMSSASLSGVMGGMSMEGSGSGSNNSYMCYIVLSEEGGRNQEQIKDRLAADTADLDAEITVSSGSSMDMSALTGSGVAVNVYGSELDTLLEISNQVAALMGEVPGITDISTGQEEGDAEVRVVVNKDEAMRLGLTVAQVYAELAQALTTDTTSTTLTVGQDSYTVEIVDTTKTPSLSDIFGYEFETTTMDENGAQVTETHTLGEFATRQNAAGVASIARENQSRLMTVSSATAEGYNTTRLSQQLQTKLATLSLPDGYSVEIGGESTQVNEMVSQMAKLLALALVLIYLVMVAQFQSLLSPFIVLFTVPLAFTGGMLALLLSGETLSMVSLMGFLVLMGVIVNNGIVFVDYTNQLRMGGLPRVEALVATGKTRMRPILMTTLTTILAMVTMVFSSDPGSEMGKGMAIVIIGGLLYATLMTLFIVPVMYDMLFRKAPVNIDVGDDGMDDLPDDAAEFAAALAARQTPATVPAEQAPFEQTLTLPKITDDTGKEEPRQ